MSANGGSGQEDVADEGPVPVFAEEADGFGFGEGIEGIPLGWGDGLAAEGGGGVPAAAVDVDAEHAGVEAGAVAPDSDGGAALADGWVRDGPTVYIKLVTVPPPGLQHCHPGATDRRVGVAVEGGKDVRTEDAEGVVVDASIIAAHGSHAVAVVAAKAHDGEWEQLAGRMRGADPGFQILAGELRARGRNHFWKEGRICTETTALPPL